MSRYKFLNKALNRKQSIIWKYLQERYDDWYKCNAIAQEIDNELLSPLMLSYIDNWSNGIEKNYSIICKTLVFDSVICTVMGDRGSGKTVLLCDIIEEVHKQGKKVCVMNMSEDLPEYVIHLEYAPKLRDKNGNLIRNKKGKPINLNLDGQPSEDNLPIEPYSNVPNNCILIHEELQLDVNSKIWATDEARQFLRYLSLTRHKGVSIIFSSQIASNLPIDLIRMSNLRIFKMMNIITGDNDRDKFMQKYTYFMPINNRTGFVDFQGRFMPFKNNKPYWFTDNISKAFK